MSQGLCTSCGAAVNLAAGQDEINCTYCGTLVKRPEAEAQFAEVKNSKFGGTLLIAETAQEGGSYTEALNYYNKVIEQQPDFADAWLNKGTCTVRTSKIGDLKIPEAISSWKAAIKFAKNPDAMKKRVALEINNAVTDFYPVLERHYLEFHSLDNSLSEHGSRFMLLESALSLAMELNPTITICKNGISLCDEFVASIKKAAGSDANAAAAQLFQKDWKGALSSAATAGSKGKVASDLEKTLQQTKSKYEQMLAKADPEFARQITIRAENQKLKAVKDAKDAKQGGIGCLMIICVFLLIISGCSAIVRTLKSQGLMETTQDPSEHVGPAIFFSIVCVLLIPIIVVLFRKYKVAAQNAKPGAEESVSPVQHIDSGKYVLRLIKVPADKKIAAIKTCREIRPSLGLAEAKTIVENLPQDIVRSDDREVLEKAQTKLYLLGLEVEIGL